MSAETIRQSRSRLMSRDPYSNGTPSIEVGGMCGSDAGSP